MKRFIYQDETFLKETDEYDFMPEYLASVGYKKYEIIDRWTLKNTKRGEFLSETMIFAKSMPEFHKIYNAYLIGKETI